MLRRGESRALPVADKARRTSGSGQNFGGSNAASKFWAPQQDIAAEIDTKNMPPAYFLNVSTPPSTLRVATSPYTGEAFLCALALIFS